MTRWIGRSIALIALIHLLFGLIVFRADVAAIFARGVFNTVGSDPQLGAVVWFLLFTPPLLLLGFLLDHLEANRQPIPSAIGYGLLAMTAIGVLLMPDSGFWLVIAPAVAIVRRLR